MANVNLFSKDGSSYIAAVNKYVDRIWFGDRLWPSEGSDINKYETEVVLSGRVRHLEKSIRHHISGVSGLVWVKFISLMQNSMPIAVI